MPEEVYNNIMLCVACGLRILCCWPWIINKCFRMKQQQNKYIYTLKKCSFIWIGCVLCADACMISDCNDVFLGRCYHRFFTKTYWLTDLNWQLNEVKWPQYRLHWTIAAKRIESDIENAWSSTFCSISRGITGLFIFFGFFFL